MSLYYTGRDLYKSPSTAAILAVRTRFDRKKPRIPRPYAGVVPPFLA
jgi:hypothetical protein